MRYIKLDYIKKINDTIIYEFECSEELSRYFSENRFFIQYQENIETVPDGVAAIPFVCNVLPIVWLTDSELIIDELDADFYHSIPEFKKGYVDMFPEASFLGKLNADKTVNCSNKSENKGVGAFFSGGLDAFTTMIRHIDESPTLISIWGADVAVENIEAWGKVDKAISSISKRYSLPRCVIKSSFRQFDNEGLLHTEFYGILKDGWWHGVKHGIGLISHAAPYAWLHKWDRVYIASSNCPSDGKVTCASDPTIDNYVRFCGCEVVHDGFEMSRQEKIKYVSKIANSTHVYPELRVCWETKEGNNCCNCEKCYRTMMGLWAEGEDPKLYGFKYNEDIFKQIKRFIKIEYEFHITIIKQWKQIQEAVRDNKGLLMNKDYYESIKWILTFDFDHPRKNFSYLLFRLKSIINVN